MKKYLLSVLLIVLFFPGVIFAQTTTGSTPRAAGPFPIAQQQAENKAQATATTSGSNGSSNLPIVSDGLIQTKYLETATCTSLKQAKDFSLSSQLKCNETIKTLWTYIIGLVDTVTVVALLAIAFATILHINYDTYGVKKALPAIIIGLVMAHFSLLICRYIVDFAQVLEATFYNSAGHLVTTCKNSGNSADGIACGLSNALFQGGYASINNLFISAGAFWATLLLSLFIIWIPTVIILILAVELYIRVYLLFFLTIIAPAAWLAISWGPIQGMFKKWWGEFVKWTFMGPLVMFYLWMSIKFYTATNQDTATFGTYLLSLMMLYLAVMAPKALGGAVGGFISNKVLGGVNKGGSAALKSYTGGAKNLWNGVGNIKPRGELAKKWGFDGETSIRSKSPLGIVGSTPGDLWKGYKKEKTDNDELRQGQVDAELAKKFGGGAINDIVARQPFFKGAQEKAKAAKELSDLRHDTNYAAEKEKRRPNPYQNMSPAQLAAQEQKVRASDSKEEMRQYALAVAGNPHVKDDPLVDLMDNMKLRSGDSPFDDDFIYRLDNEQRKVRANGIKDPLVRDEAIEDHFGSKEKVRGGGATRTAEGMVRTYSTDRLDHFKDQATKAKDTINNSSQPITAADSKRLANIEKLLSRIREATSKNGNGKMIKLDMDLAKDLKITAQPGETGAHIEDTVEALKKNTQAMENLHRYAASPATKDLSNLMKSE